MKQLELFDQQELDNLTCNVDMTETSKESSVADTQPSPEAQPAGGLRQLEFLERPDLIIVPPPMDKPDETPVSTVAGVNFTPQGLILSDADALKPEDFNCIFRSVVRFAKASNWLLGDTLLLCERRWGVTQVQSKYAEAVQATGLSNGTLRNIVATCRAFPPERRHERLSFSHHQEAACFQSSPEARETYLLLAESEKLSCPDLRKRLRKDAQEKALNTPAEGSATPNTDKPFGVLPLPTQEEADRSIPCALELSRFTFWATQHPAESLPPSHRTELRNRLQPIVEYASLLDGEAPHR